MIAEERLEALIKELNAQKKYNRWLQIVMCMYIGVGSITYFSATNKAQATSIDVIPSILQASSFMLVNEDGESQGGLSANKEGPSLFLYDKGSKNNVEIQVRKDSASLSIVQGKGGNRVWLRTDKDGMGITYLDGDLKSLASFRVCKDGSLLSLSHEDSCTRIVMFEGDSFFEMMRKGKRLIQHSIVDYQPSSVLSNKYEKTIWSAP